MFVRKYICLYKQIKGECVGYRLHSNLCEEESVHKLLSPLSSPIIWMLRLI